MQPSMTLVLAVLHFRNCTHLNGYYFTVGDVPGCSFVCMKECARKYVLLPVKIQLRAHKDKQGITCNSPRLVPDPISILVLLRDANSSNFAYDGCVRCRLLLTYSGLMWHCSRFHWLLLLVWSIHMP